MYENSTLCTFIHQVNATEAFIIQQANAAGAFVKEMLWNTSSRTLSRTEFAHGEYPSLQQKWALAGHDSTTWELIVKLSKKLWLLQNLGIMSCNVVFESFQGLAPTDNNPPKKRIFTFKKWPQECEIWSLCTYLMSWNAGFRYRPHIYLKILDVEK